MDVLAFLVLLVGILGLDEESVGTEVVTLSLEQVGGQILGAVSIKESQCSAERRHRNTSLDRIGDAISPAILSVVDSLVEEVVEEQVFKVRLGAVSSSNVLQEDGSDDTTTTPHESDRGLVELPAVLLGSLFTKSVHARLARREESLTVCISMKPWA